MDFTFSSSFLGKFVLLTCGTSALTFQVKMLHFTSNSDTLVILQSAIKLPGPLSSPQWGIWGPLQEEAGMPLTWWHHTEVMSSCWGYSPLAVTASKKHLKGTLPSFFSPSECHTCLSCMPWNHSLVSRHGLFCSGTAHVAPPSCKIKAWRAGVWNHCKCRWPPLGNHACLPCLGAMHTSPPRGKSTTWKADIMPFTATRSHSISPPARFKGLSWWPTCWYAL